MKDIRTQLPDCPLEYQVPHIPGGHTAIVIDIDTRDIDWQERMLPWTLASLINNTDIVMKGVHLYVRCEATVRERIAAATASIEIQNTGVNVKDDKIVVKHNDTTPLITLGEHGFAYDTVCRYNINYWALRDRYNTAKLPLGHVLRHNWGWGAADYALHPENCILDKASLVPVNERARWLYDANTAVYGEGYHRKGKNVANYFFNETEPNWHLDTSLLQYPSRAANDPVFIEWATQWKHLGTQALIALWLLKTDQHAYNLRDSLVIEFPRFKMENTAHPRLCNMQFAATDTLRHATQALMGAHINIAISK